MENGTQSNSASIPVPAPRKKHTPPDRPVKPSAGIRSSVDKPPIAHKPPIAAKPKISPKPSLEPKSSAITSKEIDSTEQASMIQKQRPLSIKVTDDGIHNKVANELSSILCKPRTTSKGLLSPTNYSSEQNSGSTLESPIASQTEASQRPLSPPKPVPRPRQSISSENEALSPTSPTAPVKAPDTCASHLVSSSEVKKSRPSRPPPPVRPPRPQKPPGPAAIVAPRSSHDKEGVNNLPTSADCSAQPPRTTQEESALAKKKLEITVLGARPMSEVGFRDVKSQETMPDQVSSNSKPATAANITIKNDRNSTRVANNNSPINVDGISANTAPRKPTIIRPTRRPVNDHHSDTDSLVTKENNLPPKVAAVSVKGNVAPPRPLPITATAKREPPSSLPIKKDPWNQIAKQEVSATELSNGLKNTVSKRTDSPGRPPSPKPTKTIMDQSLDNSLADVLQPTPTTSPETDNNKPVEPSMFFHTESSEQTPSVSKPSALQRIYEAKKTREEKNPDKYKHRQDCYVDKPNVDMNFWKPSDHSRDEEFSSRDTGIKQASGDKDKGAPLIAYAAFAYKANDPSDLALKAGQEVRVTAKVDKEWLYGEADGQSGTFPALYVSVSEDDIDELPLHKPNMTSATALPGTALYDFKAEHDSELSLKAGDIVTNVESVDGEWSLGRIGEKSGIFPTAFVRLNS
ncbi:SH3 domain-containing protein 19-like isoform X2 [Watersipora subatra]|uniref:SH3 domain-containing protein 19-like isoform X2 n=1 Tax=Watersipora subatra TaxID=2589382 RepID=UPI00355BA897